jgi:hypothetical protein
MLRSRCDGNAAVIACGSPSIRGKASWTLEARYTD